VIFGSLAGTFQGSLAGTIDAATFSSQLRKYTLFIVYLGLADFVLVFLSNATFMYAGSKITGRTREKFLVAVLRQNIAFFDRVGAGEVTTTITSDMNIIQDGISEKVPLTLTALATFVSAFIVGFVRFWKLTLILCSAIVAITITMGTLGHFIDKYYKVSLDEYGKGGSLVEEVLSSIRNATAFNAQDKLARQYDQYLLRAEKAGFKTKAMTGICIGILYMFVYLIYVSSNNVLVWSVLNLRSQALSFWQGSRFLMAGEMNLSQVLTIQLVIIVGSFSLGSIAPAVQAMTKAVSAASKVFTVIDRVSPIDSDSDKGAILNRVDGRLELCNVKHIYPSRPEVVVLQDVSLVFPAGKTTALVGASGSGKSTIVGLIERFYMPVKGQIMLDGTDICKLNLRWLRQQISLVSQEPILFSATVYANIAHGLIGTPHEGMSTPHVHSIIEEAAKTANAHDFISKLPQGYETPVGERGFLLSGGQKQRIAIARAIVNDPKILLLDEATSALDTKNEGVVQAALEKAAQGRTTIVVAHRLSTIKNADNIVVMNRGNIVEQGTHHELLEKEGVYNDLVEAQKIVENIVDSQDRVDNPDEQTLKQLTKVASLPNDLTREKTNISTTSLEMKKKHTKSEAEYSLWTLCKFIASFNKKETKWMLLGLAACVIQGCGEPASSFVFAKSVSALANAESGFARLRSQIDFWSGMYLMLAGVMLIGFCTSGVSFGLCSEKLIRRVRYSAFRSMLRQDMAYFDQEKHSAGILASALSTEATSLAGISGVTLGTILMTVVTLVAACTLGLVFGWKMSLVCIATMPILLGCGYFRYHLLATFENAAKKAYERSAAYACEAASAIRTVASLTREKEVVNTYKQQIEKQISTDRRRIFSSSILYAAAQSLSFWCTALGFWYGGTLVGKKEYDLFQFFLVYTVIVFGSQSAGTVFTFAPDMGKSRSAASSMKELFDRQPVIDTWSNMGSDVADMKGHVEFKNVHFRYPTRPGVAVLRGLSLTIEPGQYIALVGSSGCGKSTTISLLERFYDALSGSVLIDGLDITSINLNQYRSRIALVSQEPTLYQGTIRENILLGAVDEQSISQTLIESVCRQANIYDFVISLPNGFNTIVGSKGSMLSGGQKQRIAIARALLNNPTILLLDEATSALDSESEKVVQEALDQAAKGRTTIAVAHRLSTIQRADLIYVIDEGRVVEQGRHTELMRMNGRYCELVNLQNLG